MPHRVGWVVSMAVVIAARLVRLAAYIAYGLVFLALAAAFIGIQAGGRMVRGLPPTPTAARMRHLIKKNLPLGSTVEQTIAFLQAHHVPEFSDAVRPNRGRSDDIGQTDPDGSTLGAAIRDTYSLFFFVSYSVLMQFGFNAQGQLTWYEVDDSATGL